MSDCGSGCGIAGLNPGANVSDHKVLVDNSDTTPDYLSSKVTAGAGINLTVINPGANEELRITATGAGSTPNDEIFFPIANQTIFTLANTPSVASTVQFYVNGTKYTYGIDFTVLLNVVTWLDIDFALEAGDVVDIYYTS